jgi:hypothetical protein
MALGREAWALSQRARAPCDEGLRGVEGLGMPPLRGPSLSEPITNLSTATGRHATLSQLP